MPQQQPARRKTQLSKTPVVIPDKLYFRIGDVARLCSLPAYVLRFWETEFPQLKPNKGGTGQRLYRKRDVEMVLEIKRLLYGEGFTIAGARRLLGEKKRAGSEAVSSLTLKDPVEAPQLERKAHRIVAKTPPAKAADVADVADVAGKPKIKDLRAEMRELLSILGSDPAERKPAAVPTRRETKKTRLTDEPTLF
jgi:DNA-binding transcriptional MerR regulator